MNITFLVIIAIANSMGTIPSAGVGVAEKLCAFVMLVPSAYMQSMSAFVAQNIGRRAGDQGPAGAAVRRAVLPDGGPPHGLGGILSRRCAGGYFRGRPGGDRRRPGSISRPTPLTACLPASCSALWAFSTAAGRRCSSWRKEWSGPWGSGCGGAAGEPGGGQLSVPSGAGHPCLHGGADFPVRNLVPAALPPAEPAGADTEIKRCPGTFVPGLSSVPVRRQRDGIIGVQNRRPALVPLLDRLSSSAPSPGSAGTASR